MNGIIFWVATILLESIISVTSEILTHLHLLYGFGSLFFGLNLTYLHGYYSPIHKTPETCLKGGTITLGIIFHAHCAILVKRKRWNTYSSLLLCYLVLEHIALHINWNLQPN
jgi:hypothetical protein